MPRKNSATLCRILKRGSVPPCSALTCEAGLPYSFQASRSARRPSLGEGKGRAGDCGAYHPTCRNRRIACRPWPLDNHAGDVFGAVDAQRGVEVMHSRHTFALDSVPVLFAGNENSMLQQVGNRRHRSRMNIPCAVAHGLVDPLPANGNIPSVASFSNDLSCRLRRIQLVAFSCSVSKRPLDFPAGDFRERHAAFAAADLHILAHDPRPISSAAERALSLAFRPRMPRTTRTNQCHAVDSLFPPLSGAATFFNALLKLQDREGFGYELVNVGHPIDAALSCLIVEQTMRRPTF